MASISMGCRNSETLSYICKPNIRLCLSISVWIFLISLPVHAQESRKLHAVHVEPSGIDPSKNEVTRISWDLSEGGIVSASICNLDGKLIRILINKDERAAGEHQATWNGRDDGGNFCPNGAYLPIIKIKKFKTADGNAETYNPTASPWGETVYPKDLYYDVDGKVVHYRLERPALCRIRVGEYDGGPLYRTLIDWEPRKTGPHDEPWDGMDENRVLEITKREKHYIVLEAFSLPENAIMILRSNSQEGNPVPSRSLFKIYPPHGKNINPHARHARDGCHELSVCAKILGREMGDSGIPILKGAALIKVPVKANRGTEPLINKGLEVYLYLDGLFLYEILPDKLPAILKLDTLKYQNGEHVLTVNARTMEDHVGAYSMKIGIGNEQSANLNSK